MQNSKLVLHALKEIITNPIYNEDVIKTFFSLNYHQIVNGKNLNFDDFINHIKFLKQQTTYIKLTVIASAASGNTVFTHHKVVANKVDGTIASFEVLAHFSVMNQKIASCKELTRVIDGVDSDQDFGSKF